MDRWPHVKTPVQSRGRRQAEGKVTAGASIRVCSGQGVQGKVNHIGLANLTLAASSSLQCSCMAHGSGILKAEKIAFLGVGVRKAQLWSGSFVHQKYALHPLSYL